MRKLFRSKRGLSTVISTILMIMVTVIGMSIVFAYVAVYTQAYQSGLGSSVLESLTIEDVCLNSTINGANRVYSNDATVSVYNSGEVAATINGIFVDGKGTSLTAVDGEAIAATSASNSFQLSIYVPVGGQVIVTVQGPYPQWYSNTKYDFKVTTLRGSAFDDEVVAP